MRGKLDVFPVCDLLRFGLRDDCTGVIEVRSQLGHGRIAFAHGWILEATSPSVEGHPSNRGTTFVAVSELMGWAAGRFEIEVSSNDPIRQIALEVELARLLREALVDHEPVVTSAAA